MKTGVYKIQNIVNQKVYIGSAAKAFNLRKNVHFSTLKNNKHKNGYLQKSWNKYGEENFIFEIVEYCLPENCIQREQFWIDYYKSYEPTKGYNISKIAGSIRGHKFPKEVGIKRGIKLRGRKFSKESRKRMSIAQTGKKLSEETKRKISEANKGRKVVITEAQKEKLRIASTGRVSSRRIPVIMLDLNGNFIKRFNSMSDAAKELNPLKWRDITTVIMNICKKKQKTLYKKYTFRYAEQ